MWGFSSWGELGRCGAFQLEQDDETRGLPQLQSWNRLEINKIDK